MVDIEKLKEIGLSDCEAKIFIALLKLGEASVAEISQSSGLHRTNIYDSLEKLKEKGFVAYISKENKQFFRATEPESLLNYLKEREESIKKLIPELKEMQSTIQEKVTVEVFKGKQGLKSVLKDILLKKEEVIGYSIAGQLRQFLPAFAEYYFREQTKHKIKHRFIYTKGVIKPPSKYYEIKYLPKEFSSTTLNLCYDNLLLNIIWEPEMIAIKIKSKQLAEDFKKHFDLLWKLAKK
jgi:sugar-specific transcriptional regulator TrmB